MKEKVVHVSKDITPPPKKKNQQKCVENSILTIKTFA